MPKKISFRVVLTKDDESDLLKIIEKNKPEDFVSVHDYFAAIGVTQNQSEFYRRMVSKTADYGRFLADKTVPKHLTLIANTRITDWKRNVLEYYAEELQKPAPFHLLALDWLARQVVSIDSVLRGEDSSYNDKFERNYRKKLAQEKDDSLNAVVAQKPAIADMILEDYCRFSDSLAKKA